MLAQLVDDKSVAHFAFLKHHIPSSKKGRGGGEGEIMCVTTTNGGYAETLFVKIYVPHNVVDVSGFQFYEYTIVILSLS